MTKFSNGPAAGAVLSLRRAPLFLRAVQDAAGKWDALDQVHDAPEVDETVTVYRRVEFNGHVHLRMGKGSGFYAMAVYELHEAQPSIEECCDTAQWQAWARTQAAAIEPTHEQSDEGETA